MMGSTTNVVLGVTGGIAAYKSVLLIRELQKRNCDVKVAMTSNARRFVGEITFQALTNNPVFTEQFSEDYQIAGIRHTGLADWADCCVVAPATANIIGKMAHGIADDFLSTFLLACNAPKLVAPAMNPVMYLNQSVQKNIELLKQQSIRFVGPETGEVACGHSGPGKLIDPLIIADQLLAILGADGDLKGKRLLITAGPTREAIDPVRFITNRSSGKMGFALAAAAVERGATVTLISGIVSERFHDAVRVVNVVTATEMNNAVQEELSHHDALIMSAAVADWKPANYQIEKWKKSGQESVLNLIRTPDVLYEVSLRNLKNKIVIGFAAETQKLMSEGQRKLKEKNLDAIVVNDVSSSLTGFNSDQNQGVILDRSGEKITLPVSSKRQMADRILDHLVTLFSKKVL